MTSSKHHFYNQRGFTIVELLIVIVIIGILAAIVIVAYNGITSQALESAAKSDLANFHKKAEMFKAENGHYPSSIANLNSLRMKFSQGAYATAASTPAKQNNLQYCRYDNDQGYALLTLTANGTRLYISSKSGGPREYTGTDVWINSTVSWGDNCMVLATSDTLGDSVVEPDFEEFTTALGGVQSGASGTPDYGATTGYWNTANRDPKWHAWTTGGSG